MSDRMREPWQDLHDEVKRLRERYELDRERRREHLDRALYALMGAVFGFMVGFVIALAVSWMAALKGAR
jgi:hypothetical protein